MNPVRVPAEATVFTVGQVFRVPPEHPFHGLPCPVCDEQNGSELLIMVYVGSDPDDRHTGTDGLIDGAGIPVHAVCTNDNSASFEVIRRLRALIDAWRASEDPAYSPGLALAASEVQWLISKVEGEHDKAPEDHPRAQPHRPGDGLRRGRRRVRIQ